MLNRCLSLKFNTPNCPDQMQTRLQLRIVATRGQGPVNYAAGEKQYTRYEGAYYANIGSVDVYDIRLAFCNVWAEQNGETTRNLTDYKLSATLQGFTGNDVQKLYFFGRTETDVHAGAKLVISDPSGLEGSAGERFQFRCAAVIEPGTGPNRVPLGGRKLVENDQFFWSSAETATQIHDLTTMRLPVDGTAGFQGFAPVAVLGYQCTPAPALIIWGDSLSWGLGDTGDGNGNSGALARGTWKAMGNGKLPLAYANVSRSGDQLRGSSAKGSQYRRALLPYATHIVCGLGNNDINNGQPLHVVKARMKAFWFTAKRAGLHVSQVTMTPRTTSTDQWSTAANQTVVKGFESSGYTGDVVGQRGALNDWIKSQVGVVDPTTGLVTLDEVLDFDRVYRDPKQPDKWATNGTPNYGTADGVHTAPEMAAKGGDYVRPLFGQYRVHDDGHPAMRPPASITLTSPPAKPEPKLTSSSTSVTVWDHWGIAKSRIKRISLLLGFLVVLFLVFYQGILIRSEAIPVMVHSQQLWQKHCFYFSSRLTHSEVVGDPQETAEAARAITCPSHF